MSWAGSFLQNKTSMVNLLFWLLIWVVQFSCWQLKGCKRRSRGFAYNCPFLCWEGWIFVVLLFLRFGYVYNFVDNFVEKNRLIENYLENKWSQIPLDGLGFHWLNFLILCIFLKIEDSKATNAYSWQWLL